MVRPWPDLTKVASDFWSNLVKKLASGMFSAPASAESVASDGEVCPVSTFDSMPGLRPAAEARSLSFIPSAVRSARICAPTSASSEIFGVSGNEISPAVSSRRAYRPRFARSNGKTPILRRPPLPDLPHLHRRCDAPHDHRADTALSGLV
jgi:hypothetical protein